ncbi:beta-mannosidase-like [Musca domestica]|uniref:beta-mannosidase n=1 Tax=Musca domestica TaxID=7370 RepID=A0ABM3V2U9_MUSDO|nr:beta-mannosidase-like [Musca domestica]
MLKSSESFALLLILVATAAIFSSSPVKCDKVKTVSLTNWNLSNENKTITLNGLKSPIGVYSALRNLYGDVLYSKNDEALRWIAKDSWTFSTTFSATLDVNTKLNLTFHGIDTVSTIRLNNKILGLTDNMFIRYSYDITTLLQPENVLEIEIRSPIQVAKERAEDLMAKGFNAPPNCPHVRENGECHRNMLRKMQMSFGGNWNLAAPSIGLWKPVELEYYEVAIMRDVDVAMRRNDTHWTLDIRVFLTTGVRQNFYAELLFIAAELLDTPLTLNRRMILYNSPLIEFQVHIPKDKIKLWWPNGYGEQKLYPLYFVAKCYTEINGPTLRSKTKSQKTINIGFRTIELEEDLDDYGRNFYFKVNDQPIFVKGASYVPSHILPEHSSKESSLEHIIKSAKETHLNMIRVWGGGLYESDTFYNLTDHYGLLVWQEMAFSGATYPMSNKDFVESVRVEVYQNAKRLAFHPSFAMIVTNDEIEWYLMKNKTEFGDDSERLEDEYRQLFMGTIRHELNVISRNDFNPRAGPMISTPSMGVEESKKDLSTEPQNPNYGDVHFWDDEKDLWDPDIYPRARFITEYGFQSLPIRSSWNRTMYPDDEIADIVVHRQHDPKGFTPITKMISRHFRLPATVSEENIDKLIYLSQITQAMAVKTATDLFRSERTHKRTMGAMYWQLNDAWVAPTWSSIDYFGNYKLLWYWSREFMAPIAITALIDSKNDRINITVTKDEHVDDIEKPESYNITIYTYLWSELYFRRSNSFEISVTTNGIYKLYIELSQVFNQIFTINNSFLKFNLVKDERTLASTYIFPTKFHQVVGMTDPQLEIQFVSDNCQDKNNKIRTIYYSFIISVKKPAVFVYLELYHPEVHKYKFSENGFVLTEPIKIIHAEIELKNEYCIKLSADHVKVFHLNQLYAGSSGIGYSTSERPNFSDVTANNNTENGEGVNFTSARPTTTEDEGTGAD